MRKNVLFVGLFASLAGHASPPPKDFTLADSIRCTRRCLERVLERFGEAKFLAVQSYTVTRQKDATDFEATLDGDTVKLKCVRDADKLDCR
jgi:hypothetical protein